METAVTAGELKMGKSKAERRAAKRRAAVERADRVGPTPETLAKLQPDPLVAMHDAGLIDDAERDGALEIRRVYMAIVGAMVCKARGVGGRAVMSPEIAWIHRNRYLPWAAHWSGRALAVLIDMIVDGVPPDTYRRDERGLNYGGVGTVNSVNALKHYAEIRRAKPLPPPDELAIIAA